MKELFYVDFNDKEEREMRTRLLAAQMNIDKKELPVVLVSAGLSGSGRSSTFTHLWSWMNTRDIVQNAYGKKISSTDTPYRRFWRDLPKAGQLGLYLSSWYTEPLTERAYKKISKEEFEAKIKEIRGFEKTLADNGYIIMKYWLDISKKHMEKYLAYLEEDPKMRWKIMDYDYDSLKYYDEIKETFNEIVEKTDSSYAPWYIIDDKLRQDRVASTLKSFCSNIENIVKDGVPYKVKELSKSDVIPKKKDIDFSKIEFEKKLSKEDYDEELKNLRSDLNELFMRAKSQDKKIILCFEGPDASGKGGIILRITSSLNQRLCKIFPISKPNEEEIKHHYLWRFWKRLSAQPLLSIFDRSWYGRVLVERIEKLTPENLWIRGFKEINHFERQLASAGNIIIKVLLYISKDEQLERFEAREDVEYKQWKITDEDWRNREKWDEYDEAFADMITLTNTKTAPWIVVATNNKKRARINTMKAIKKVLQKHLLEE